MLDQSLLEGEGVETMINSHHLLEILILLSFDCFLFRRRRTYKGVPTLDVELSTKTKAKPILMANFKAVCAQQHCNSDHGFQQEYEVCLLVIV